ncbi:MAG: hypothetical protein AAB724_03305 [Patescibacteria group bacterium]
MITYFLDIYDQVYNFFNGTDWATIVLILKITGYAVSFFLLTLIVILLKRSDATWWIKERQAATRFAYGATDEKKWQQILTRLKKGNQANLKLAVLEADNLFGDILRRMGLPGKTTDERLRQFETSELASLAQVQATHELRNQIVQNSAWPVTLEQVQEALAGVEAALKELEYL